MTRHARNERNKRNGRSSRKRRNNHNVALLLRLLFFVALDGNQALMRPNSLQRPMHPRAYTRICCLLNE